MTQQPVTIWYLEQHQPSALRRARVPTPAPLVLQARVPSPELSRFLYTAVGGPWYWRDRLSWSLTRWQRYLQRPEVQTWVAYSEGTPAGYIELEHQQGGDVQIAYFGLLPSFTGRGLGGHLLTVGIDRAWAMEATRVWVHTCSLDGPTALANYEARGMQRYRSEIQWVDLPDAPDGPWPGWNAADPPP